jgi:hypothetical protein
MPNPQTNLRLNPDIRAAALAAADSRGITLAALVEQALGAYLGLADSSQVAGSGVAIDLVARVEALEKWRDSSQIAPDSSTVATAPKRPAQNRQQGASKPPRVCQQPPEAGGLTIGAALIAAGVEITEAHAMGSNRDQRMVTRYGIKAAPWLEALGWVKDGRKWFPPD